MKVECPRCSLHPVLSKTAKWIATGLLVQSRLRFPKAQLQCAQCGQVWSSGLPAALEAATVVRQQRGDEPVIPPPAIVVPAPTLFGPKLGRTTQPMVSANELARSVIADYKRRQAGEE